MVYTSANSIKLVIPAGIKIVLFNALNEKFSLFNVITTTGEWILKL